MQFTPLPLAGAYVIDLERRTDGRGFFARSFCAEEFLTHGLTPVVAQANLSVTTRRGTVRGMHYQTPPGAEVKLIRCTRGAVYDVIVDVRPASPTYLSHVGVDLTSESRRAIYVPEGCAHGFQTLEDDTEVVYQVSAPYAPECERGLRCDDPLLGIHWPLPIVARSPKDEAWPLLQEQIS